MQLTPGLNFINVLTYSFYARRSQKRKKIDDFTASFTLLGSVRVKAVRKNVDEIDTWSFGFPNISYTFRMISVAVSSDNAVEPF